MKVKELIAILEKMPQESHAMIYDDYHAVVGIQSVTLVETTEQVENLFGMSNEEGEQVVISPYNKSIHET